MRRLVFILCVLIGTAASVAAQDTLNIPPPILTIDQDRLFSETRFGSRASDELENRARALAAENAGIEAELIRREGELTELRAELTPEVFRERANAFDADVQRIRLEQDDKARELNKARDEVRQEFFNEIAGIISDIVRERGALVVIDRRDVFLSADRIDITDAAIERINQKLD